MEIDKLIERDGFGGFMPVENVQDLNSRNLEEIPSRYLRTEDEILHDDEVSPEDSPQIPVIDMSKLLDHQHYQSGHQEHESSKLHYACKECGFFQLINHGVPEEVVEKMKADTWEFFRLPLEEKKLYAQRPNSVQGYGRAFAVSQEEKLDWLDVFYLVARPVFERNMAFWPTNPTSFRESLDKYSSELKKVAICLLEFMSTNLGLEPETLANIFENGRQSMRMNFYPHCLQANKVMGLSPHCDLSGITVLLQANDVQSLQIKKNGKWLPVKPIPGAFIVNIGGAVEMLCNGEYKSVEHRVIVNPEKQRLSIATFFTPDMETMVGPLTHVLKENKAKYKTVMYGDYLRRLTQDSRANGKSLIDEMKLDN